MMNHKTLILTKRKLCKAPRVRKEIDCLHAKSAITVVGYSNPNIVNVTFIDYKSLLMTGKIKRRFNKFKRSWSKRFNKNVLRNVSDLSHKNYQRQISLIIEKIKPDVIIIHEPEWLPFVTTDDRAYKVIFNAHEYYPKQVETAEWQKKFGIYYKELYANYLKKVDLLINVSDGIAAKCLKEYGKSSIVINNAGEYVDAKPKSSNAEPIRIVYHGAATPARNLENIIHAVSQFPEKFSLDLMVDDNINDYVVHLRQLAADATNINVLEQVPYEKITMQLQKYDLGIHLLPDTCFNHRHALPNKVFEYIQARLGLIVSPLPEMEKLVARHGIGIVTNGESKQDCIDALANISITDVEKFKHASHDAASLINAKNAHTPLVDYLFHGV
jgi:hypothetical protein